MSSAAKKQSKGDLKRCDLSVKSLVFQLLYSSVKNLSSNNSAGLVLNYLGEKNNENNNGNIDSYLL